MTPLRSSTVKRASNWNAWARTTSSSGTVCLPPLTLVIITSVVPNLVLLLLSFQPDLHGSEFLHHARLGLPGRQDWRAHGPVHASTRACRAMDTGNVWCAAAGRAASAQRP